MKTVFLIGGCGNQFFQLSHLNKNDTYSTVLLKTIFRNLFSHTVHDNIVNNSTKISDYILLFIALIDIVFFKLFKITLFTKLDLNLGKSNPIVYDRIWIGYFQDEIGNNSNLNEYFNFNHVNKNINLVSRELCIHLRAGDIYSMDNSKNPNGILGFDYYNKAIDKLNFKFDNVFILSDNIEYACELKKHLGLKFRNVDVTVLDIGLSEMIVKCINTDYFIASNSSLSYWISILRKGVGVVVPSPFIKKKNYPDPYDFNSIKVEL